MDYDKIVNEVAEKATTRYMDSVDEVKVIVTDAIREAIDRTREECAKFADKEAKAYHENIEFHRGGISKFADINSAIACERVAHLIRNPLPEPPAGSTK